MLDKELHILVSEKERQRLRTEAFKKNIKVSDIIRIGIELYFTQEKGKKKSKK